MAIVPLVKGYPWGSTRSRIIWQHGLFLFIVFVALGLRLWGLDGRAIHYDEALHVQYSWDLANGLGYHHSPWMHGPFQILLNALFFNIFGDSDFTGRIGYALAGSGLVAIPFFLKRHLGIFPAVVIAILLALSPTMLYFSRFARNDIYMALWTAILLVLIWNYLNDKKDRYLYAISAVFALVYATKETSYFVTLIFGGFLFLLAVPDLILRIRGKIRFREMGQAASVLLLMVTLLLPQWSALSSIGQETLGIVLANKNEQLGLVGMPAGDGLFWSIGIVAASLVLSIWIGMVWRWRTWLVCAGIFYLVWICLYTTFFTNPGGVITGMWQGLGYWVAQQDIARGGQPWYYYFVMGSIYELLPMLFSLVGIFYYIWKRNLISIFLVFWSVFNFLIYSYAGEKMPWLMVNVALPLLFLSGKLIGDLLAKMSWEHITKNGSVLLILVTPLLMCLSLWLLLGYLSEGRVEFADNWLLIVGIVFLSLVWWLLFYRAGPIRGGTLVTFGFAALLLVYGTFIGIRASYTYDDNPIEMLVYAQGSTDVREIAMEVASKTLNEIDKPEDRPLMVDFELWFPFKWYFRGKDHLVNYKCLKTEEEHAWISGCYSIDEEPTEESLLLITSHGNRDAVYLKSFVREGPYRNLMWFPEVYKGVTLDGLRQGLTTRQSWKRLFDFLIFRHMESDWLYSEFFRYEPINELDERT